MRYKNKIKRHAYQKCQKSHLLIYSIPGQPIFIKDFTHVWARAIILPEVTIGEYTVVGPGSVVKEDVAPWTVVECVPAKYIEERPKKDYKIDLKKPISSNGIVNDAYTYMQECWNANHMPARQDYYMLANDYIV